MAFLTDQALASGVTLQDLIHIVIPSDISQGNPAGSSYKATIEQVLSGFTGTTLYELGSGTDSTQRTNVSADSVGNCSVVSGGFNNTSLGSISFVGGGSFNTSDGTRSVITGGGGSCSTLGNKTRCNYDFIGGGIQNVVNGEFSSIVGGGSIIVGNGNTVNSCYSTIIGGERNILNHNYSSAVGTNIVSQSACTLHVNYLSLFTTPTSDSSNNNILVRDSSTGVVKLRNISTTLHNYGSFYSRNDQPIGSAGTTYTMSAETTSFTNGVSISSGGRYTLTNGGVYNIQFSTQLEKNSGTKSIVFIWLYKNGSNVPHSNTEVTIDGANGDRVVAAWNFVESFNPGEYFEIRWTATNTNTFLSSLPSPTYGPEIPSVILTITQVA